MHKGQRTVAVIPARDEAQAIGKVVSELLTLQNADQSPVFDEILVCDNGSTDDTWSVAKAAGAHLVYQPTPGYGLACLTALQQVQTPCVLVFIDGDHSFYAEQSLRLLDAIHEGAELAIGSRVLGNMESGALSLPQRFGNWLAAVLIRLLWRVRVTDLGPYRAIRKTSLDQLGMQDVRYGWTIEMQIKAIQQGFVSVECPVDTRCRIGQSKISGTLTGVIGAARGILGTLAQLRWRQYRAERAHKTAQKIKLKNQVKAQRLNQLDRSELHKQKP